MLQKRKGVRNIFKEAPLSPQTAVGNTANTAAGVRQNSSRSAIGRDDGAGTQTGANGTPGTAKERLQRREDRTKKGTQTGANGSPRGVDDRHEGNLRIIHCDFVSV